jgi:hypothetical protein
VTAAARERRAKDRADLRRPRHPARTQIGCAASTRERDGAGRRRLCCGGAPKRGVALGGMLTCRPPEESTCTQNGCAGRGRACLLWCGAFAGGWLGCLKVFRYHCPVVGSQNAANSLEPNTLRDTCAQTTSLAGHYRRYQEARGNRWRRRCNAATGRRVSPSAPAASPN